MNIDKYNKIIKDEELSYIQKGDLLLKLEYFHEAIEQYEKEIYQFDELTGDCDYNELGDTYYIVEAWYKKAIALRKLDQIDAAIECCVRAISESEDVTDCYCIHEDASYLLDSLKLELKNGKKLLNEFVIFDLETIGLEKESGKIIEIAALKIRNWEIVREYNQLVNPDMKIPRVVTNLTGIRNVDVEDQPLINECLGDFLDFIEDLPLVGHNIISFDAPFIKHNLEKCGLNRSFKNILLDTIELSLFLLPEFRKHKLEYLYKNLVSPNAKQQHRAKYDCKMTFEILNKLKKIRDGSWEGNWLEHVGAIAKNEGWPWGEFILDFKGSLELGKKIDSYLPLESYLEMLNWEKVKKIESEESQNNESEIKYDDEAKKKYVSVGTEEIARIFDQNGGKGSLKSALGKQYEYRKQQEDMAINIVESINNNRNLVIEAPTGCGKSLAYLIPAVTWSLKNNNKPVVISTYTNILQDQLFENDFKLVNQIFDTNIKITVAKGREHYVCIRKLKNYLEEISQEENQFLTTSNRFSKKLFSVFLANWVIKNKNNNCDLDRYPFWMNYKFEKFNKNKINSTRDSCQRHFCEYYSKCFINKLKLATRESNVIVSNHSLVLSDSWSDPLSFSILPKNFEILVIDEAINIEDAVTNASTVTFSKNEFIFLAKDFFDIGKPKKGFLWRIENNLQKSGDKKFYERVDNIKIVISRLLENNQALFNTLLNEVSGQKLEYDDRKEIFSNFIDEINVPSQNLSLGLNEIISFLSSISDLYCMQNNNSFCREVKNFENKFKQYFGFINVLNELNKDEYIFFRVINSSLDDCSLNFCSKDIGKYMNSNLYERNLKSVIFTSATLTYENNFNFVSKIWGLNLLPTDKLEYIKLPYLFDYEKQCALMYINELPNKSRDKVQDNQNLFYPLNADFLKRIIIANNGSALLLFTNKKDVSKFCELIVDSLEENNIPLYSTEKSQDLRIMSGNKSSVVEEFKECVESCLAGTAGLREGIDIPGESLELVIIVKLPFDVPSDPINSNRQILYGGFDGYTLPHCIFNIKQAFGRLIRKQDDNGFVFIVDARILNYIDSIRKNLPKGLNIINLKINNFENFNNQLLKTKGIGNRTEKIIKALNDLGI